MAQTIIIIMLALLSVGTITMLIFTAKNQSDNIADLYESYDRMRNNYTESIAKQNELNTNYSKSLDERERSLNDFNIRIKKLELELEAKNAEIERLRGLIVKARTLDFEKSLKNIDSSRDSIVKLFGEEAGKIFDEYGYFSPIMLNEVSTYEEKEAKKED